jgi:GH15 family glucan-1,4-alpha-glucosidase
MLDRLDLARDLVVRRSLEVLRDGQSPTGAFVAAPTYATYGFGWLRDGAFCAHALQLVGEHARSADFHAWVCDVVLRHADLLQRAADIAADGGGPTNMPPTRFTLDGELEPVGDEAWPNFQLDGYGTWLWTVAQHYAAQPLPKPMREAARLVADYLVAARDLPCFDCWEEFGTGHHTSTLGAVAAGLGAAAELLADSALARHADELLDRLRTRHVRNGAFVKQADDDRVDASALWLTLPFGLVSVDNPLIRATAERIRTELVRDGHGVVRYLGDTFYGGGAWILLTAWLAWFELESGDLERAEARYRWILAQATPTGELSEQVLTDPQAPGRIAEWTQRWGPVASPLLWSHAMFLVLDHHRQAAMAGRP